MTYVDRLEQPSRVLEIVELVDEDEIDVRGQALDDLGGLSLKEGQIGGLLEIEVAGPVSGRPGVGLEPPHQGRLAYLPGTDQDEHLRFGHFPS